MVVKLAYMPNFSVLGTSNILVQVGWVGLTVTVIRVFFLENLSRAGEFSC